MPGPLEGVRVVEFASEIGSFAGKLLADMGAEVIVVESPSGHTTRAFEPFVNDVADPERSLWWWHYNAGKYGVSFDIASEHQLLSDLIRTADILIDGCRPEFLLDALGVVDERFFETFPHVVWVTISAFGTNMPREDEVVTDLTASAAAGPVWSCGYDDHSIPPVRPGTNQAYHTASVWASMGALVALLAVGGSGRGQRVDVNMHAACNVTTELASYEWLVREATVSRQTGRHAGVDPTLPSLVVAADGRSVNTGVPPRSAKEFRALVDWLHELDLAQDFEETFFLEMGGERESLDLSLIGVDAELTAIYSAAREALSFIAAHLPAYDFFLGAQSRGLPCGIIYSPEEVMTDPQMVARGFPVDVWHDDLDCFVQYPGVAFSGSVSECTIRRRAPRLGEHNDQILGPLRSGVLR